LSSELFFFYNQKADFKKLGNIPVSSLMQVRIIQQLFLQMSGKRILVANFPMYLLAKNKKIIIPKTKTMPVSEIIWSDTEQEIAQTAFQKAYQRETSTLIEHIKEQSTQIAVLDDIWQMHDYLSARRHQIDGKYDYRYASLIFVFAQLLKEGWLKLEDLNGLEKDKLAKIAALSRM
jgi:hypothetical protein